MNRILTVRQDGNMFYNVETGNCIWGSSMKVRDGNIFEAEIVRAEFISWLSRNFPNTKLQFEGV